MRPEPEKKTKAPEKNEQSSTSGEECGNKEELERVRLRVKNFDWKKSKVWKILTQQFGEKLTHEELTSVAELLSNSLKIKLDRDAKRRKIVLVKWFEENWSYIEPVLRYIVLDYEA